MRTLLAALLLMSAGATAAAVQVRLDPRDVAEAIAIGQTRGERERARFHGAYRLDVNRAPVDYIEVVTPFRRVVLAAEARASTADRSFGQRDALAVLGAGGEDLDIRAELTFHPLNTYVGVPGYSIVLQDQRGERVEAGGYERLPRYGPRVAGTPLPLPSPGGAAVPGASDPMLGGAVVGRVDLAALDPSGVYDVIVEEDGRELARARLDLRGLR